MMKIIILASFLLVLVFALFIPYQATAGEAPPDEVMNSARVGLNDLVKDKRLVNNHQLGFENQVDVDNSDLGEGFQMFTIPPDKLSDESVSQDFQAIVVPTPQWRFLIVVANKAQALLDVNLVDGKWLSTAIGASKLAKEMSGLIRTWPASSGYRYRFVRVYSLGLDLIELSREGSVIGIIHLNDLMLNNRTRLAGAFVPGDLRNSNEVLTDLRTRTKAKIELRNNQKSLPANDK